MPRRCLEGRRRGAGGRHPRSRRRRPVAPAIIFPPRSPGPSLRERPLRLLGRGPLCSRGSRAGRASRAPSRATSSASATAGFEFLSPLLFGTPAARAPSTTRASGRARGGRGARHIQRRAGLPRSAPRTPVLTVTRAIPGTDWGARRRGRRRGVRSRRLARARPGPAPARDRTHLGRHSSASRSGRCAHSVRR